MHFDAEHFHAEHFRAGYWQRTVSDLTQVSPTVGPRGHNRGIRDRDWWELYGRLLAAANAPPAQREKFDKWPLALMTPEEERRVAEQAKRTNAIEAMLAELEQRTRR